MSDPLLNVEKLSVVFRSDHEVVQAVKDVSFSVKAGETIALVGESGSGKTVAVLSALGLLPPSAEVQANKLTFQGTDLLNLDESNHRMLRGNDMAMVFQEPMTSLNPLHTIERQVAEPLMVHHGMDRTAARHHVIELLEKTGITQAKERLNAYPHQLSGGQRQRVMIAMALACRPKLLIADEPTTALDVTIQAQILQLLKALQAEFHMGMVLITHDLPMVRQVADRVCVMHNGRVVETAATQDLFENPTKPYTKVLINSLPSETPPPLPKQRKSLYIANDVKCHFPIKKGLFKRTVGHIKAVDGVSLTVYRGETIGVVGESGSGKTTLGEALLKLIKAEGKFSFDGASLNTTSREELRMLRRRMQVVFQDPFSSLSPRMTIGQILEEGLLVHKLEPDFVQRQKRIIAILDEVGMPASTVERYPHQFSGGQRQRIAIARTMVLDPDFVVLDEPTSALDLSVQAQILELLLDLQQHRKLAYLFISHDLRVVRAISHQVLVLLQGQVVESGSSTEIFNNPQHPYTQRLLNAALRIA
ncbi:MAG: ABC transporter ATP-binding protein [Magnetococcales bacterium]|nr:ABC transporter ATP-binding protein [Magnetococcales bacterium]